jgi:hypothetical protein
VSIYEGSGARQPRFDDGVGLTGAVLTQKNHIGAESLRAASGRALAVGIWNSVSLEEKHRPKEVKAAVELVGVGLLGTRGGGGARTAGGPHLACQGADAASGGRAV